MKKERIKSVVLVLLVLSNLVMAYRILVNKKLWLSGYNFFVTARNKQKKSASTVADSLAVPEKIIVNTGYQSSRFDYKRSDAYFGVIFDTASEILKKAFAEPSRNISSISPDEWYTVLTAKSVYLSYPCSYSAQIFSEILGLSSTEAGFESFSDIAIGENGSVYIKSGESFFRISVPSEDMKPIIQTAANDHSDDESVINYSFDLNFDKDFGDQKTFLSPMIAIYSAPLEAPVQNAENPLLKPDGSIDSRAVEDILPSFSINPNTVWRYTEADGSMVFVENNGILRISPEGVLSYKASDSGIRLSGVSSTAAYSNVAGLAAFIDRLNSAAGIDADMCLTSQLTSPSVRNISFDYIASGLMVKYPSQHAVSAVVSGGYITEYSQIIRSFSPGSESEQSPLFIEALDEVIAKYQNSMSSIRITRMFPAYVDDMSIGEKKPDWYIEIDNNIAE